MYTVIGVSLVSLLAARNPTGASNPAVSDPTNEWPAVKQGVWSIEGTLIQKRQKRRWKATTRRCDDASTLFQDYWGRGKAEKDDCLFQSTKMSPSRFEIVGECLVDKTEIKSESTVIVKGDTSFKMQVRFQHGKVTARAKETGRWLSACRDSQKEAAAPAPVRATSPATAAGVLTATGDHPVRGREVALTPRRRAGRERIGIADRRSRSRVWSRG